METTVFDVVALVVAAAFALAGSVSAMLRARRRQDAAMVAARAGLEYAADDPFDCTRVAFALFSKGDGRGAENVMWLDSDDGHSYRVFDYWYFDERRDEYGRTQRSYHRWSCAMALVGSSWPEIQILREGVVDRVMNSVTGGDIDFESEEFNRMFEVRCADRRFATALLDPSMLQFLLTTKGALEFEIKGRWLLAWTRPAPPRMMPALLAVVQQFVARIPKVVWDLYPSDFVDPAGRPLPAGDDFLTRLAAEEARLKDEDDDDPFAVLEKSPFEALERHDGVQYDLDGHPLPPVAENPWGDGAPDRTSH